jgi:hypothetical protein
MGLQQHKAKFMKELISGEILAECDESVLEQDLDMMEPAHRSKLMSIIRGENSPVTLMADYSYVRFKPTAELK